MGFQNYIGMTGVVMIFAWAIFVVICNLSQDRLVEKWKAKEKSWIEEGTKGFGARLIKEIGRQKNLRMNLIIAH